MASPNKYILAVLTICLLSLNMTAKDVTGMISGKLSSDGEPLDSATVYLTLITHAAPMRCSVRAKSIIVKLPRRHKV